MYIRDWENVLKRCGFMVSPAHLKQLVTLDRVDREPNPGSAKHHRPNEVAHRVSMSLESVPAIEKALGLKATLSQQGEKKIRWHCGYCGDLSSGLICNPEAHEDQHEQERRWAEAHDQGERTMIRATLQHMTPQEREERDRLNARARAAWTRGASGQG